MASISSVFRSPGASGIARLMRETCSLFFSFEMLFAFFLFMNVYRSDPRFSSFPVEISALAFAASVIVGGVVLLRERRWYWPATPSLLAGGAFIAWACLSVLWVPGNITLGSLGLLDIYHYQKLIYMATLIPWCLLAPALIIAPDRARVRRFMMAIVLLGGWLSLEALMAFVSTKPGDALLVFGKDLYTDRLGFGRAVGLAAIIAYSAGISGTDSAPARILWMGLFGTFCLLLLLAGGRGAALSVACALLVPIAMNWRVSLSSLDHDRQRLSRRSLVWIGLLIAGIVYGVLSGAPLRTVDRFANIPAEAPTAVGVGDQSIQGRLDYYGQAIGLWLEAPMLGHGLGSWPIVASEREARDYPHNMILEIMAETGAIGLILFGVLVFLTLRRLTLDKLAADMLLTCVIMLLLNTAVNAMISGDVPSQRYLFAMLGLATLPIKRSGAAGRARSARLGHRRTSSQRRSPDDKTKQPDGWGDLDSMETRTSRRGRRYKEKKPDRVRP